MMSLALKYPSPLHVPSTTAPRPSAKRSGGVPLCLIGTVPFPSDSVKVRERLFGSHLSDPGSTIPPRRYAFPETGCAFNSLGVTK
jgi:hypothetical protein